jgi:uroporphyrinogen-III synthase
MSRNALSGVGVVVTRPEVQAQRLAEMIRAAGGEPIVFPAMAIRSIPDSPTLQAVISGLARFHIAVFISPNAVACAFHAMTVAGVTWPAGMRMAAVGPGGRRALEERGYTDVLMPEDRYDSEGLLRLPAMTAVAGLRVVIFRGQGGRELLADVLRQRGAEVTYAECYERVRPDGDIAPLLERWRNGGVSGVVFTSSEAVRNFVGMLGANWRPPLDDTPAFVTHERIARAATEAGFRRVVNADPGDEGLLARMMEYFS